MRLASVFRVEGSIEFGHCHFSSPGLPSTSPYSHTLRVIEARSARRDHPKFWAGFVPKREALRDGPPGRNEVRRSSAASE